MSNLTTTATRALTLGAAALALTGAAYAGTAIGHADNNQDVRFINQLSNVGINANSQGVAWGQGVCTDLDYHYNHGWSARDAFTYAVDSVYDNTPYNFTWSNSIDFVAASVAVYCPRHDPA